MSPQPINPGDPFDRLTVVQLLPRGRVLCRCECLKLVETTRSNLRSGNTRSCGCLKHDTMRQRYQARRTAKHARPLR